MSNVDVKGADEIGRKLARLAEAYPEAVGAALYQEAELIMGESAKLCPVDTSRLLMSRFVTRPKSDSTGMYVLMGYGTDYALYVHEMPSGVNWTRPGSGSKFLQRPLDSAKKDLVQRISRRAKANVAAGVGMTVGGSTPEAPRS